jgi:hypothetical protein
LMVARLDLLLFTDVLFAKLSTAPTALYLPHHCVPNRVRLPQAMATLDTRTRRLACNGGKDTSGQPAGRRLVPAQLSRYAAYASGLNRAADFGLFVLDYFFIASHAVATSFAQITDRSATTAQKPCMLSRARWLTTLACTHLGMLHPAIAYFGMSHTHALYTPAVF